MTRYLIARAIQSVLTVVVILVLVFFAGRAIGNPVDVILPLTATAQARLDLATRLGLDQPLAQQLWQYLSGAFTWNMGDSYWQGTPALEIVISRLPKTLYLAGVTIAFAHPLGILLGSLSARRPGSLADRTVNVASLTGVSVVDFWLGLVLIAIFGVHLGFLPTGGYGGLAFVILPAATLAVRPIGRISQFSRSTLLEEYGKPYVTTLRSQGLSEWRVYRRVAKNSSVPIVTLIGDDLAALLMGAVVVETVFAWPGVGSLLIEAITRRDLVLVEAVVFVVAIAVVLINWAIDLSYALLNPRIRLSR